jgi:putative FmdB family regulatory protein
VPIYEYRCEDGHDFEVFQNMTDDPVTECEVCGKPVQRVFSPVAVHYKGSGFYTTDYARKGKSASDGGKGDSKSDTSSGDSKKSESKSSDTKSKSASAKD